MQKKQIFQFEHLNKSIGALQLLHMRLSTVGVKYLFYAQNSAVL
jgi:hypothetical protein